MILLNTLYLFGSVDNVPAYRISFHADSHIVKIPYYRNFSLGSNSGTVNHAIIVIHGKNRNADGYYNTMLDAAWKGRSLNTAHFIMAPQFLIEDDMQQHNLDPEVLFWKSSGWPQGDISISTPPFPTPVLLSSYSVMDSILLRLAQTYTKLDTVVIAGHSAGGQFVQRYAAGNPLDSVLFHNYGIHIRYIVANPSSYVYLNNERRVQGTTDQFAVPQTFCKFNDYKYGLENLNSYMSDIGVEQILTQYSKRDIIYMLGEEDIDPDDSTLDKSCEAMYQGNHRLERGIIFYNYINHFYSDSISDFHIKALITNVGHDHYNIFNSDCGVYFVYNYGYCDIGTNLEEKPYPIDNSFFLEQNYPNPFNIQTTFRINIPFKTRVHLDLYDLKGENVQVILNQEMNPGIYHIRYNAHNLSSGMYLLRLTVVEFSDFKKIILLK
jgi:hypothetical protein